KLCLPCISVKNRLKTHSFNKTRDIPIKKAKLLKSIKENQDDDEHYPLSSSAKKNKNIILQPLLITTNCGDLNKVVSLERKDNETASIQPETSTFQDEIFPRSNEVR
ncbi:unnamed protein product, partial [Didymodactylos carnosus]